MKNNIRYKGNTNNTSAVIFFNWRTKTPSDVTLLGRTSSEVFVMLLFFIFDLHFVVVSSFVDVLHFVVVLHSHFLSDVIPHPSVDYRRVFTPILYFQPSPSQSDSRHLHFSTIPLSSCRERYGLEWTFFTHRCFLPCAPSPTF